MSGEGEWRYYRVLRRTVAQEEELGQDYYRIYLDLSPTTAATSAVFGLLSSRDDSTGSVDTIPAGWTSIQRYYPNNAGTDIGLTLAWGPASGSQTISMTHAVPTTSFNELVVAELSNVTPQSMGTPATALVAGGTTGMSIDVVAGGAGIILVGIRVNNWDDGGTWTSYPADWVTIFRRNITGGAGERDWGAVLWGYKPVSAAGTYTLSFTGSSTYSDWYKVLVGVWMPSTAVSVLQTATSGESLSSTVSATFPSPF